MNISKHLMYCMIVVPTCVLSSHNPYRGASAPPLYPDLTGELPARDLNRNSSEKAAIRAAKRQSKKTFKEEQELRDRKLASELQDEELARKLQEEEDGKSAQYLQEQEFKNNNKHSSKHPGLYDNKIAPAIFIIGVFFVFIINKIFMGETKNKGYTQI